MHFHTTIIPFRKYPPLPLPLSLIKDKKYFIKKKPPASLNGWGSGSDSVLISHIDNRKLFHYIVYYIAEQYLLKSKGNRKSNYKSYKNIKSN